MKLALAFLACAGAALLALALARGDDPAAPVVRREQGTAPEALSPPAPEPAVRPPEPGPDPERRWASLAALSEPQPETFAIVLRDARGASHPSEQVMAIDTAAAWMARNPALVEPIATALAEIARSSAYEIVRGHAIQAVANVERALPSVVLEAMGLLARTDPSPQNRLLAAMALGTAAADQRSAALGMLQAAHAAEPLADVRRSLLIHVIRAGGDDAEPLLRRMAAADPAVAQDVRDYLEILQGDPPDAHAIFEAKFRLDAARGTVPGPLETHHD